MDRRSGYEKGPVTMRMRLGQHIEQRIGQIDELGQMRAHRVGDLVARDRQTERRHRGSCHGGVDLDRGHILPRDTGHATDNSEHDGEVGSRRQCRPIVFGPADFRQPEQSSSLCA